MASDINKVFLVGRLTRDAELKYTNTGTAVSKFSLAVNRNKRSGDQWSEEANFFDLTLWGKQAEAVNQYLTKGKQVAIEGELRQNRWEQDGQKRSKVEINVNHLQLLGGGGASNNSGNSGGGGSSYQKSSVPGNSKTTGQSFQHRNDAPPQEFEDDIPF
jgi:single-strand DNA-binding protein